MFLRFKNSCSTHQVFPFQITARDPDLGENGRLSFSLCEPMRPPEEIVAAGVSSTPSTTTPAVERLFEIGESRGEISLLFSPDRETVTLYGFLVCVVDHGEPPRSAVTKVKVTIRDTNDCQPQFERSGYEFFVQVSDIHSSGPIWQMGCRMGWGTGIGILTLFPRSFVERIDQNQGN